VVTDKSSRVELFLCAQNGEINKSRFHFFQTHKESIEKAFGEPLIWEFKEGRKQHYVRSMSPAGGLENETGWVDIQNDLVDRLIRLEAAIKPLIKQIN
jgi:hypothetical protein